MSKITEGPWESEAYTIQGKHYNSHGSAVMGPGGKIADVLVRPGANEREANAQAISAVPELIEALTEARDWCLGCGQLSCAECDAKTRIDAALEKAGV